MAAKATPAKLSDGSWGARTTERVVVGSVVTVRTQAGKTWTASVSEVVWTDGNACLVRTQTGGAPKPARRSGRGFTGFRSAYDRQRAPRGGSDHPWGDDL
jgi:hypothetical protein